MELVKPASDVFRENLRAVMDRDEWTMDALAESVGTSRSGISRILAGKDGVTLERAERIATAVGEPLSALLIERQESSKKIKQTA